MNIVKRSLPYTKDFDRCEWRNACAFISQNLRLVGFVAALPGSMLESNGVLRGFFHEN